MFYISGVYAQRASRAVSAAGTAYQRPHCIELGSFHSFAVGSFMHVHAGYLISIPRQCNPVPHAEPGVRLLQPMVLTASFGSRLADCSDSKSECQSIKPKIALQAPVCKFPQHPSLSKTLSQTGILVIMMALAASVTGDLSGPGEGVVHGQIKGFCEDVSISSWYP